MSPSRKSVEDQLREELDTERKQFDAVRAEFRQAMATVPTGIPSPDGTDYLKRISEQERAARERWQNALQRFNDYVIRRVVPDDLR